MYPPEQPVPPATSSIYSTVNPMGLTGGTRLTTSWIHKQLYHRHLREARPMAPFGISTNAFLNLLFSLFR